jgi:two-component system phosphate regulon sensor histidine kinase PhoR
MPIAGLVKAVLGGLSDAAVILDDDAAIVATNSVAEDALGAVVGRHVSVISRLPDLLAAVETARLADEPTTFHLRLTVPVERHLIGRITPLVGPARLRQGRLLLLVLRDLTEQEQLVRLRADFVANASHELKTPLTALRGFLETLQGSARDDPVARERFIAIMLEQSQRMARLIDDLLSLSQIEMRQHVLPRDVVDLAAIVREVVRLVEPLAQKSGITVRIGPLPDDARVAGDHDELLQVAQNLVQNAVKYGRKGGWVDVSLKVEGSQIALVVADNGIGIAPEHLPRLTERFYRVNVRESHMRGGTGLGLAIVKHIVNRHHGDVRIDSKVGEGSTFTIRLPRTMIEKNIYNSNN